MNVVFLSILCLIPCEWWWKMTNQVMGLDLETVRCSDVL